MSTNQVIVSTTMMSRIASFYFQGAVSIIVEVLDDFEVLVHGGEWWYSSFLYTVELTSQHYHLKPNLSFHVFLGNFSSQIPNIDDVINSFLVILGQIS